MKRFKKSIVAIGVIIIGFSGFIQFSATHQQISGPLAYAQDDPNVPDQNSGVASTDNKSLLDLAAFLDLFLNFLYIIIRPLLAITGLALDNSLVYGEVFGMTVILRRFRSVMMQISFLLLALAILRDIASGLREQKDLKAIMIEKLKSRILAGIFIPMSRFLVSALVDLSTILIYQVGGIPLSILKSDDNLNIKILSNHSVINLTDALLSKTDEQGGYRFSTLYSCGGEFFTVCKFEQDKITPTSRDTYIAQTQAKYSGYNISKNYCVLSPTLLMSTNGGNINLRDDAQLAAAIAAGTGHMTPCASINSLIESSKSMVGPLYTIYGSLLNFTSLNVTVSGKSTEAEVILFLLKGIVGLLLIIPLIALAATSIARVGILWIVIAFSPFIALYRFLGGNKGSSLVKDVGDNLSFKRGKGLMEYKPSVSGIVQLIFQPVFAVLALGISLIFLSATNNILGPVAEKDGLLQAIGIEVDNTDSDYQTFKIHNNGEHTTDIAIKKFDGEYATSIFFDYFTRIIANLFGILIMRNMMFMALKSASFTKGLADKIQSIGEDYLATRPIFGGYSRNSVKEVANEVTDAAIKKIREDTTIDNAKELSNFVKARMPGSKAYNDHNSAFAIKDPATLNDEAAANTLAKGISGLESENKNFHYLNTKDTPNLAVLGKQLGLPGNLEDMVQKAQFWDKIALSKDAGSVFRTLNKALTDDKVAANLVGSSKTKIKELRSSIQSGTKDAIASYTTMGTDGNLVGYKTTANSVAILQTEADPNKQAMIKAISTYSFGKTDKTNVDAINGALGSKGEWYDAIGKQFGIVSYDDPTKAPTNEVFLNTSNNNKKFEFKSQ